MGVSSFVHSFEHYDWRIGIRELQKEAEHMYGDCEGYSGEINCCTDFKLHRPRVSIKTSGQLDEYIHDRFNYIAKRAGEVIELANKGYLLAKPVVQDYHGVVPLDPRDVRAEAKPWLLVNEFGMSIASGSLADLKSKAKRIVMHEKFEKDYLIIKNNLTKIYIVTGESTFVKTTKRVSDSTCLVLPYNKYIVYGFAPS